jgi:hydrogenase maturation protease
MPPRITLFVCGEPERGDDAAAFAVLDLLPEDVAAGCRVERVGQLDPSDLVAVAPDERCLVLDTVAGIEPGEVWVCPLDELSGPRRTVGTGSSSGHATPRSSHILPLPSALALAATIRGAPLEGAFLGIGGVDFHLGAPLSTAVVAALPAYASAIVEALRGAGRGGRAATDP